MVEVIDVHGLPMISAYLKDSKDVFIFSARARYKINGALFTLSVPKLSFVQFAPSADAIFAKGEKKLTVSKSPRNQRKTRVLQQRCVRISAHKYSGISAGEPR